MGERYPNADFASVQLVMQLCHVDQQNKLSLKVEWVFSDHYGVENLEQKQIAVNALIVNRLFVFTKVFKLTMYLYFGNSATKPM